MCGSGVVLGATAEGESMTLYDEAKAAGLPMDSYESDLYLKDSPQARALLRRYGSGTERLFTSQTDGGLWWDVPFQFLLCVSTVRGKHYLTWEPVAEQRDESTGEVKRPAGRLPKSAVVFHVSQTDPIGGVK